MEPLTAEDLAAPAFGEFYKEATASKWSLAALASHHEPHLLLPDLSAGKYVEQPVLTDAEVEMNGIFQECELEYKLRMALPNYDQLETSGCTSTCPSKTDDIPAQVDQVAVAGEDALTEPNKPEDKLVSEKTRKEVRFARHVSTSTGSSSESTTISDGGERRPNVFRRAYKAVRRSFRRN